MLSTACDSVATTNQPAAARFTLAFPKALVAHSPTLAQQTGGDSGNNSGDDVTRLRVRISVSGRSTPLLDKNLNPEEFCNDPGNDTSSVGNPDDKTVCTFPVEFTYPAGSERATFEVTVDALDGNGVQTYKIGPASFQLSADGSKAEVIAQAVYVGPGSDATGVIMSPRTLTIAAGSNQTATCSPTRGGVSTNSYAPMHVHSENDGVAGAFFTTAGTTTSATSIQVFGVGAGTTKIVCELDFGTHAFDAIDVTVTGFVGLTVQLLSGGGQTGNVNTALPNPIVVRVVNSAGQPMPGIGVGVGFGNGSGSASPSNGLTDGNGNFTTTWTLGPFVGTQMLFFGFGPGQGQALTVTATGR